MITQRSAANRSSFTEVIGMPPAPQIAFLPGDAWVTLEGGYYTIRPYVWSHIELTGPRKYYFEVAAGTPKLSHEQLRRGVTNDAAREWVVLSIPEGENVEVPATLPSGRLMTFDPPMATEQHSFETAVRYLEELKDHAHVTLAVLIGDLFLPPEIRDPIEWALPPAYEKGLRSAKRTIVLTESHCRAVASRQIVAKARKTLRNEEALRQLYHDAGCSIVHDVPSSEEALYLASDALLDCRITANPIIALTKDRTKPACAATIAAKMRAMLKRQRGPAYHIAWYDTADDPDIRNKNVEGFFVAACFFGDLDADLQIVTLSNGRVCRVDHLSTAQVRKRGIRTRYENLLLATDREGRHYGIDFVLSAASADCCVYHTNDRVTPARRENDA